MTSFFRRSSTQQPSASHRWAEIFGVLGLLALVGWLFIVFNADHRYPPCCDTAVTMMKAKVLAEEHSLHAFQRFNPSYHTALYGSIIGSEIISHLVLALAYRLHHPWMYDLVFAKHFFLILFLSPAIIFYLLGRRFSRHPMGGLVLVALVYVSYWFGNAYWSGHVAEFIGFFVLGSIILILDTATQNDRPYWYLGAAWGLLIFLFFVHVLAFMVAFSVTVVTTLFLLKKARFRSWWLIVGYGLVALILVLYLKFLPISTTLVPSFGFNDLVFNFPSILSVTISGVALLIFFFSGMLRTLTQRKILLLTWFIVSYLLSQSTLLGASFFSFRFSEFMVPPIMVIVVVGLSSVLRIFPRPLTQVAVIIVVLASYLPFGLQQQNQLKQCYIQNCIGLNPTQIPDGDIAAFQWMSSHLAPTSRILAFQKFGYYLPVLTDFSVEFPEIDKAKIYTSYDSQERWSIAKKYGIQYIYWDAVFLQQRDHVLEAPGYTVSPFKPANLFKKIYDDHGAKIYQVL